MKKTTLDNGLTILTYENPFSKSVTLSYSINAGSFDELNYPAGTAHFIEHMLFKGTKTRTYKDINKSFSRLGGLINAATSFEETKYYCVVPYDKWKESLELLSDMVWNHSFPKDELEKERKVIIEEIKEYADDVEYFALDTLFEMMHLEYKERKSITGTIESVSKINRDHLISFVNEFYQPNNMIIVATGNIKHEKIVEYMENYPITRNGKTVKPKKEFKIPILETNNHTLYRDIEQSQLAWGIFGPSSESDDKYVMEVILAILAGDMNSRLYDILREQKGLVYSLSMSPEYMIDEGIISGFTSLSSEDVEEVKNIIKNELKRLTIEEVDNEELEIAIASTSGSFMIGIENNTVLNEFMVGQYLSNNSPNPNDTIRKIRNVTANDIKEVAKKYFKENNIMFLEILPN